MPNWCFTTYRILGPKEDRDKLYNAIKYLDDLDEPKVESDFGNLWLGCLVDYYGGNPNDVYCRGEITDYENEEDCLRITTETAWRELYETRHFLEGVFPGLKFFYLAEEPNMGEYYTNDKERKVFPCQYYLDTCDIDDVDEIDFYTLDDAIKYIHKILPELEFEPDLDSINNAFEEFMEEDGNEDKYIHLYEYEYYED